MSDKVFVDTNILVYARDTSAADKHKKAREKVTELWESGLGVLSTQVLQELYNALTRKIPNTLPLAEARSIISDYSKWDLLVVDAEHILDAINIQERHGFSFWDCLIISAAAASGAGRLLTEDLSNGQTVRGILIENPLL